MTDFATSWRASWRLLLGILMVLVILWLVLFLLYRAEMLPIRITGRSSPNPAAVVLANGDVLSIGDPYFEFGGPKGNPIERYDPVRDRWQRVGSLEQHLYLKSASLLPDGSLLVIGKSFDTPEIARRYDPLTGVWSAVATMPRSLSQHVATSLRDGTVLLVGTGSGQGSPVTRYDSAGDRWLDVPNPPSAVSPRTATLLADGRVLVVGGWRDNRTSAALYDPVANSWQGAASLNRQRYGFAVSVLNDGRVLISGGDEAGTAEIYDPSRDQWQMAAPLATPRFDHTATTLGDGTVLVVGGQPRRTTRDVLASAERYDPVADRWISAGSLRQPRYMHAAALLADGRVLIVDGYSGGAPGSAERYDPDTGRWMAAGGITISPIFARLGFLNLALVAFWAVCFVAVVCSDTGWGGRLFQRLRLARISPPLTRRARVSLLALYSAQGFIVLNMSTTALNESSLWPYGLNSFWLSMVMTTLAFCCLVVSLFTRSTLTSPESAPVSTE